MSASPDHTENTIEQLVPTHPPAAARSPWRIFIAAFDEITVGGRGEGMCWR
jgi:hypothetical protein